MSKRRILPSLLTGSIAYLLILLPAAFGSLYVHLYGVNAPYNDAWTLVPLFEKLSSGTLTVADLFAQHNEHRIFFPRIAMLLLGTITSFNDVATMYLIQAFLLVTLAVLLLAFRSSVSPNPFLFVPIAFLVFSWGQSWNMLQGFQTTLVFVQTFGVLAFYLLYVSRHKRFRKFAFPGALGSGTVASFSAAPGLLVWPVGFLQLLILPVGRSAKRFLLAGVWGLVGLLEWVVYYLGYEHTDKTAVGHATDHPLRSLMFFLAALGGSLFKQQDPAFYSGFLLVFLAAVGMLFVYKDGRWGECSFWIAVLSFCLLVLAGTTLARAMSIENALNQKYVTYSVLAPIAVYAMLAGSIRTRRKPFTFVALAGVLLALIVSSVPLSYAWGVGEAKEIQRKKEKTAFVLATYRSQPDRVLESKGVFRERLRTNPKLYRQRAAVLERLGYSVFSERRPRVLPPALHTLSPARSHGVSARALTAADVVQIEPRDRSGTILEEKSFVEVAGWAVDTEAKDTAGEVYVVIDGKPFPAFYGTSNKEVAERLDDPAYEYSGFWRAIPVSEIGPGAHELSIIVVTNDGERYYRPDKEISFEVE